MITNADAWKIYAKYVEGWKAVADEARARIAADVLSENIRYQTPQHNWGTGRTIVIEDMASFQSKFPGCRFDIGDVSAHHDTALLRWILVQADGQVFAEGHDQITIDADGRIASLITFAPSVPKP